MVFKIIITEKRTNQGISYYINENDKRENPKMGFFGSKKSEGKPPRFPVIREAFNNYSGCQQYTLLDYGASEEESEMKAYISALFYATHCRTCRPHWNYGYPQGHRRMEVIDRTSRGKGRLLCIIKEPKTTY